MNLSDTLVALAACLCEEFDDPTLCFCGILPGGSPYDAMGTGCTKGQAWVRLASGFPSDRVGEPNITPGNCNSGLGVAVEVGVLRPFPIQAQPLDAERITAASLEQIDDMLKVRHAIVCCDALNKRDYVLNTWAPLGPEGGVVGGAWTLTLGLL